MRVELANITKLFGSIRAVDNVSLTIGEGEFFTLLGPSGCGKTTLLRTIAGFYSPDAGEIRFGDRLINHIPAHRRETGMVFQNYALFPHLTIYENVAFGLRRKGVKDNEVKSRVTDMLKLVELPGFEARKPGQISGGQAQRVALARALINRPAVLLLDEPLGALDLKLRKQMQLELKRIQQEVGITFIYVTHDQEEAMTMSDRIAVMNKGRYEQLAEPETLYERPATRFVAGFLGVSNLLPATADGSADGFAIFRTADGSALRAPKAVVEGRSGPLALGVRPEKIRMEYPSKEVPAGYNSLAGTVTTAAYLGVSTQYVVELKDGHKMTVYEQNVERATRAELWERGEDVRLSWSPDHGFVVPAEGPAARDDGDEEAAEAVTAAAPA